MSNLKRSDNQYVEVEEFADYELTQCIAYEMAIRDDEKWIKLSQKVVTFYKEHKDIIDYAISTKDYTINDDINKKKHFNGCEKISTLDSFIHEIYIINLEDIPLDYKDPRLSDEFWSIKAMLDGYYGRGEKELQYNNTSFIQSDWREETSVVNHTFREGYFIETYLSTPDFDCYIEDENAKYDGEEKAVSNISEYKQYVNSGKYVSESNIKIIDSFKRPMIGIDELKTINIELSVNLNRPLNELIAYITHIKQDIEQNNLVKLPIELLGIELKRGDNLVCNEKGEKCFDPRSILTKQQKMADMFYIYDCLKLGYSQTKIRNEVYNYYADKGMEISLDPATLRKYRDIAIEYIDNKKYKEMITGISIDDLEKM